jgi:hypothetical protein
MASQRNKIFYQLTRLYSMASQMTKFFTNLQGYILWRCIKQNVLPTYKATFYGVAINKICYQLTRLHSMASQKTKFFANSQNSILWYRRRQNLLPAYNATFYGIAIDNICKQLTKLYCITVQKKHLVSMMFYVCPLGYSTNIRTAGNSSVCIIIHK